MVKNYTIAVRCNRETKKKWKQLKEREEFESPAEALREAVKLYLRKNPDRILIDSNSNSNSDSKD